ncbi:MAG: ThiF family adenylyltransferase [Planctomycetes bacterium]|nr:ThiF family adenylyltransferase [Planctomycetota bacterium]
MNTNELFKRTMGILRPETARRETFLIVGVGSGGARVAEEVVRFGVGRIILVDRPDERLEEHNIIRHILGYSSLGRLKTEALRDRLLDINPSCRVDTLSIDVTASEDALEELVQQSTQLHLCTDNEASKHVINALAVRASVPLIFAGVFDGGVGGEVGRCLPGDACYACVASFLNRSGRFDESTPATFDYSNPSQEQYSSTAALNIDIAQITLIQARVALLTMRRDAEPEQDLGGNYVLFGNRPVEGLFPRMLFSEVWNIPKDPSCLICGGGSMTDAEADQQAARLLQAAECAGE